MATTKKASSKSKAGNKTARPKAQKSARKSAQKAARKSAKLARSRTTKKPAKPTKSSGSSKGTTSSKAPKAVRLTFSYEGDKVKLLSQQPVEMTVPPSDALGYGGQKGFWAELKSEKDKTLYRHVMHNPTRNDAEVFSDDPAQGISRAPTPKRKGVFVVVVPATAKGYSVRLCRSPVKASEQSDLPKAERGVRSLADAPAEEFARYKLKK